MYHVIWPQFTLDELIMADAHKTLILDWLNEIYENVENGDIALSECIFAYISEQLVHHKNKMQWDAVLKELLTDEDGIPLAYSKQYGKRLFGFNEQWKQTPVHAVYNHYWVLSQYGTPIDLYSHLIKQMIQPSGWIYNDRVSPTHLRTRMRSELLLNMSMGTEILAQAGKIESIAPQLKATISVMSPSPYLAAEYYRLLSLVNLSAENLFVTDCATLVHNCMLPDGFCDFNVADKVDDYMGTKKRVQRDKMVASPLSTLYACRLSQYASEGCARDVAEIAQKHARLLAEEPYSIPAFKIRDLDIDFGSGITIGEIIAATVLINKKF